jgi:N utilization substance protein A
MGISEKARRSVKFNSREIACINALLNVANAIPKDCVVDSNTIIFLVDREKIGAAIGKEGRNAKKLREILKKNIEIMEYGESPEEFVKGLFGEDGIRKIEITEDRRMVVYLTQEEKKAAMHNTGRIKRIRTVMERNYNIKEFRVR